MAELAGKARHRRKDFFMGHFQVTSSETDTSQTLSNPCNLPNTLFLLRQSLKGMVLAFESRRLDHAIKGGLTLGWASSGVYWRDQAFVREIF
jgi:hypothetical protein